MFKISQSAYYYKKRTNSSDGKIKEILTNLSKEQIRWGFNKMMNSIKNQGYAWNHKRVYRIYCEIGLNIRVKPKKRKLNREAIPLIQPIQPNVCWSVDFMRDSLSNSRRFRTLNVIDDYNREALLIRPAASLPANYVTLLLEQLADIRGYPSIIRVDNGPEFIASTFKKWAEKKGIFIQHIQPGKPAQNGFIERFNRTYREDILDTYIFDDLTEVENITNKWLNLYNNFRPHEALDNLTPKDFAIKRTSTLHRESKKYTNT
jgi:putative transposase